MVKLFAFCENTSLPMGAAGCLPSWRLSRFDRLKNSNARRESLGAGLLFGAVMDRLGLDRDEPVCTLPAGKPVFERQEGLWFSLSHSGSCALCAVSDSPVGCDVQILRPVKLSVARRFCPEEQAWLMSLPEEERRDALFRLWTRKEAWVKAQSTDRTVSLDEYSVLQDGLWRFRDYILPEGSPAAICGKEELPQQYVLISGQELLARFEE